MAGSHASGDARGVQLAFGLRVLVPGQRSNALVPGQRRTVGDPRLVDAHLHVHAGTGREGLRIALDSARN